MRHHHRVVAFLRSRAGALNVPSGAERFAALSKGHACQIQQPGNQCSAAARRHHSTLKKCSVHHTRTHQNIFFFHPHHALSPVHFLGTSAAARGQGRRGGDDGGTHDGAAAARGGIPSRRAGARAGGATVVASRATAPMAAALASVREKASARAQQQSHQDGGVEDPLGPLAQATPNPPVGDIGDEEEALSDGAAAEIATSTAANQVRNRLAPSQAERVRRRSSFPFPPLQRPKTHQ